MGAMLVSATRDCSWNGRFSLLRSCGLCGCQLEVEDCAHLKRAGPCAGNHAPMLGRSSGCGRCRDSVVKIFLIKQCADLSRSRKQWWN